MKSAFVTGATGFLGLNLIQRLESNDWDVTALHLPGEDLKYLSRYNVRPVTGDILDLNSLQKAIPQNLDAVFHVAGDVSMWKKNDARQYQINVIGTANMCEAALEKQAQRFIHTSSSSAFGYHAQRLDENTPSNALTCGMSYNQTKYLAELEVRKAIEAGLFAVLLNPCNIIGPFDPGNWSQVIKAICQKKLPGIPPGMGTFAHVRDVADAHLSAVEYGRRGENYLLGGVEVSFKDLILEIMEITGAKMPLKELSASRLKMGMYFSLVKSLFDGKEPLLTYPKYKRLIGRLTCDASKATRELGFKTTSISQMLGDCYQWLRQEQMV